MQNCKTMQQVTKHANMENAKTCKYAKLGAYSLGAYSSWSTASGARSALTVLNAYVGGYKLGAYSSCSTDVGSKGALTCPKKIYRTL